MCCFWANVIWICFNNELEILLFESDFRLIWVLIQTERNRSRNFYQLRNTFTISIEFLNPWKSRIIDQFSAIFHTETVADHNQGPPPPEASTEQQRSYKNWTRSIFMFRLAFRGKFKLRNHKKRFFHSIPTFFCLWNTTNHTEKIY